VNIIIDKKLKIIYMKNWNLFKLHLEWGFRFFAVGLGSAISGFSLLMSCLLMFGVQNKNFEYKQMLQSAKLSDLADMILYISFTLIIPILVVIFILVATRKFKELNQLIEENKKL
jgi:hypothetical protein